jgi:hypothetical protein
MSSQRFRIKILCSSSRYCYYSRIKKGESQGKSFSVCCVSSAMFQTARLVALSVGCRQYNSVKTIFWSITYCTLNLARRVRCRDFLSSCPGAWSLFATGYPFSQPHGRLHCIPCPLCHLRRMSQACSTLYNVEHACDILFYNFMFFLARIMFSRPTRQRSRT